MEAGRFRGGAFFFRTIARAPCLKRALPGCRVAPFMSAWLFRCLLWVALFSAMTPVSAQRVQDEHTVDESPAQLLPATQTHDPVRLERATAQVFVRPRPVGLARLHRIDLAPVAVPRPPQRLLRSYRRILRRRIPRLRDDLGDDP